MKKMVINLTTSEIFKSVSDAEETYHPQHNRLAGNISACCKNKSKTSYGCKWAYYVEEEQVEVEQVVEQVEVEEEQVEVEELELPTSEKGQAIVEQVIVAPNTDIIDCHNTTSIGIVWLNRYTEHRRIYVNLKDKTYFCII